MEKRRTFKNLTDIKRIKPPSKQNQRHDYHDEIFEGLSLRVTHAGTYTWTFRRKFEGKDERINLGYWPHTTMEQARTQADLKRKAYGKGQNPAAALRIEKEERRTEKAIASNSVDAIGKKYLKDHIDKLTKKYPEARRIMEAEVIPVWKGKLVTEITRDDVRGLIKAIVDRGSPGAANNIFSVIRGWLNWCVENDYLETSPAWKIKKPTVTRSRERTPNDTELVEILSAADVIGYPNGSLIRLMAMLGQRRTETSRMRWSHLDIGKKLWTIPAEETKVGRTHLVPLSTQVIALLETFSRPKKGDFVLTTTDGKKAVNGSSKSKVELDRTIAERRRAAGIEEDIEPWVPHDFRRAIRTFFSATGVGEIVGEKILNHAVGAGQSKVGAIYDRYKYLDEKRAALQAWADHLDALMRTATERTA